MVSGRKPDGTVDPIHAGDTAMTGNHEAEGPRG